MEVLSLPLSLLVFVFKSPDLWSFLITLLFSVEAKCLIYSELNSSFLNFSVWKDFSNTLSKAFFEVLKLLYVVDFLTLTLGFLYLISLYFIANSATTVVYNNLVNFVLKENSVFLTNKSISFVKE